MSEPTSPQDANSASSENPEGTPVAPAGPSSFPAAPFPSAPAAPTYGAPPAPASAYPSPAQGGYTPPADAYTPPADAYTPPAGNFPPPPGGFPPAPGYAGYAAPPAPGGYAAPADIGTAFSWGWDKFAKNWGILVGAHLLWGLGIAAVAGIAFAILVAAAGTGSVTESGAVGALGTFATIILFFFIIFAALASSIALVNGFLVIADGRTPTLKDFFTFRNLTSGIVIVLLIALASAILSITFVGPLAVSFFSVFALYFAVDRGLSPIDSIKASINVALKNPAQTALLIVVTYVLSSVGAAVCGVGALVAIPLSSLITVYLYRRFSGGQVAA